MKNIDLFTFKTGLDVVNVPDADTDFLLAVALNKISVQTQIEAIQDMAKASPDFTKFSDERRVLLEKHAKKDENGKPITTVVTIGDSKEESVEIKNRKAYDKDYEKLTEKYKEALKEREKQLQNYTEFLQEETEYKPRKVDYDVVPKTGLTQKAMDGLIFMINYNKEE